MTVSDALYTYGIKDKKLDRIIRKIKKKKKIRGIYVVVLPIAGDGILEIYVYNQLLQPFYRDALKSLNILGIAADKAGACELVLNMVQDMYDAGGGDITDAVTFFGGVV